MQQIDDGAGFPHIPLIKAVREMTGFSLKESKDIIDTLKDKGTVAFTFGGSEAVNNFIRVDISGLRSEVQQALTEFTKRAVDGREYSLARTLIEILEKL
jgi:DNA-binding transcriptional MerR regulator